MKIYSTPETIDISGAILWQYENAEKLKQIIQMIQDATNMSSVDLWNLIEDIFDLSLPIDETDERQYKIRMIGLSELSFLFGIDRPTYVQDGKTIPVPPNVWRRYLQGMIYLMDSNGSAYDIVGWLQKTFPDTPNISVKDGLNMTMAYVFPKKISDEDNILINIPGFLPHPAGVMVVSSAYLKSRAFGFEPDKQSDEDTNIRGNFNTSMFLGDNYTQLQET